MTANRPGSQPLLDVAAHTPELGLILDQALRVENQLGAPTDSGSCSGHVCASLALPARRASFDVALPAVRAQVAGHGGSGSAADASLSALAPREQPFAGAKGDFGPARRQGAQHQNWCVGLVSAFHNRQNPLARPARSVVAPLRRPWHAIRRSSFACEAQFRSGSGWQGGLSSMGFFPNPLARSADRRRHPHAVAESAI